MDGKELKETGHILGVGRSVLHLVYNELLELSDGELLRRRIEAHFVEVDTVVDDVIQELVSNEGEPFLCDLLSFVLE